MKSPDPAWESVSVPNFVLAVQARDFAAARAALGPTFQGKANGKTLDAEAQMRLLQAWWDGFPRASFAMEATGGSGRHVITWSFFGVHDGPYAGIPGTGKTVGFSGFIVAVSDATGIVSLDWKWDPKVFTKAVLGPDDIGTLEVKDNFRADPSRRWQHGDGRHANQGQRKPKGNKGKSKGRNPQGQPGAPATPSAAVVTAEGAAAAEASGEPAQPGAPRAPGQGRRRRGRGKGPRPEGMPAPPAAQAAPTSAASTDPAASADSTPKPEGT